MPDMVVRRVRRSGGSSRRRWCLSCERDGKPVKVSEVVVPSLNIVLPDGNLFGEPPETPGLSAAHGWVILLHPLPPGTHTIEIDSSIFGLSTTTITVEPGH